MWFSMKRSYFYAFSAQRLKCISLLNLTQVLHNQTAQRGAVNMHGHTYKDRIMYLSADKKKAVMTLPASRKTVNPESQTVAPLLQ